MTWGMVEDVYILCLREQSGYPLSEFRSAENSEGADSDWLLATDYQSLAAAAAAWTVMSVMCGWVRVWTAGPRGAKCCGQVGPNRASVGAPTAAARWDTPESLPT